MKKAIVKKLKRSGLKLLGLYGNVKRMSLAGPDDFIIQQQRDSNIISRGYTGIKDTALIIGEPCER